MDPFGFPTPDRRYVRVCLLCLIVERSDMGKKNEEEWPYEALAHVAVKVAQLRKAVRRVLEYQDKRPHPDYATITLPAYELDILAQALEDNERGERG